MPDSTIVTATAPVLTGAWIHDPTNPTGTEAHWPYTDGGAEGIDEEETLLQFVGRRYPVLETGSVEDQAVATTVVVPFSPTHRSDVEWWRTRKRAGAAVIYRDGRGRVFPAVLSGKVAITPTKSGATIGVTFQHVDSPAPLILSASDYSPGSTDDGGYGDGGYGLKGYGL